MKSRRIGELDIEDDEDGHGAAVTFDCPIGFAPNAPRFHPRTGFCLGFTEAGYGSARIVRNGAAGHLPIIALSAFAFDHDREAALEAGMDGHVSKPFARADIVKVLARHFTADL